MVLKVVHMEEKLILIILYLMNLSIILPVSEEKLLNINTTVTADHMMIVT